MIGALEDGTTVKGNMLSPQVGLEYALSGRWENHPRFGRQFSFSDYKVSYPTGLDAIRLYLEENCKWVGPDVSRQLVDRYGKDTLKICKEDPDRVARDVSGITPRRALEVAAMLRNNEANEKLQLALKEILGGTKVSKRSVSNILEKWGQDAPAMIKANPYAMVDDIRSVGFLTADQVARKVGFDFSGSPRVRAGILHTLAEQANVKGHVCLPIDILKEEAAKILDLDPDRIGKEIKPLTEKGPLVRVDDYVYLKAHHDDEMLIAKKIGVLLSKKLDEGKPHFDGLAEDQVSALKKAVASGVFILTGAPGTGKTHLIKRLINSFPKRRIMLAAPTGKSAKRMFEQSGFRATTIHKLLDPQKVDDEFVFLRNHERPIEADVVIIDEMSMMDNWLMARFLEAIAPGTRLVMVGDTYQLPSVGPGNILKDLIASGAVPCEELTIIKRQDEGLIITNCHRIKAGMDAIERDDSKDYFFCHKNDERSISETIMDLVVRRLPQAYKLDPLRDIQVITPLREKTALGCKALNLEFQKRLNKNPKLDKIKFKVGDKVIQTKNEYDQGIINGDIGYVLSIDLQRKEIVVEFESPKRVVELQLYGNDLMLAYAITCHKFQGSEAPIVVIPIHKCFGSLIFQRTWIYTAISRAKKVCVLVGQRRELSKAIKRNAVKKRITRLAEILK